MQNLVLALLLVVSASCKQRDQGSVVAGTVRPAIDKVPARAYHFGQFKHLSKYGDRGGTFTPEEWGSIPSVKMTEQPKYRQGFYVTGHPAYSERYASEFIYKERDDSPWMATITFSDECLTKRKATVGPDLITELLADPDFRGYVEKGFNGADRFAQVCPATHFTQNAKTSNCTEWLYAFYRDYSVGIAFDNYWPKHGFWYVRDPACIARIETSSQSVLRAMAEVPEFWAKAPYDTNLDRDEGLTQGQTRAPTQVSIAILMRALYEMPNVNETLLDGLIANAATADVPATSLIVKTILSAARECQRNGQDAAFKEQVGVFVSKIDHAMVKPDSLSFLNHVQNFVLVGLSKIAAQCKLQDLPAPAKIAPPPIIAAAGDTDEFNANTGVGSVECVPVGNHVHVYRKSDNQKLTSANIVRLGPNQADCDAAIASVRYGLFCYSIQNKAQQGVMVHIAKGVDVAQAGVFGYSNGIYDQEGNSIKLCFEGLKAATAKYVCSIDRDEKFNIYNPLTLGKVAGPFGTERPGFTACVADLRRRR
jgi:hypothetical protein